MSTGNIDGERRRHYATALFAAQDGLCPYCGDPLPQRHGGSMRGASTLDHVFPWALQKWRGHAGNLLLVHAFPCNVRKGHRLPTGCEVIALLAANARAGLRLREAVDPQFEAKRRADREKCLAAGNRQLGRQGATLADVLRPLFPGRVP